MATHQSIEHSARMKARWAAMSPEAKAAQLAPLRTDYHTTKHGARMKTHWASLSPEVRAARTASMQTAWVALSPAARRQRMANTRWRVGSANPQWRGGRRLDGDGYVRVYVARGIYKLEHRLIAEQVLGRPLAPHECVHHVNGNPADNRHRNLVIMTRRYHTALHRRLDQRMIR